jgi:hypothetical protein
MTGPTGEKRPRSPCGWASSGPHAPSNLSAAILTGTTLSMFGATRSSLVTPGPAPWSTWARRIHPRTVSAVLTPSSCATFVNASQSVAWSARISSNIRTARALSAGGYVLAR